jgi:hypothetical protein
VRQLLSGSDSQDLERLRVALGNTSGVFLDRDYRYAVRAYCLDSTGNRRGLSPDAVATVLATAGMSHRIRPIVGQAQTDFMVIGIDKGTGLRNLAADLGVDGKRTDEKLLAFAAGDTVSDLPMFDLAAVAFAPANADASLQHTGVKVMRQAYQAGLMLAATHLLGHTPGVCPTCRHTLSSRDTRLLLAILAVQEAGGRGIARRAFILAARVQITGRFGSKRLDRSAREQARSSTHARVCGLVGRLPRSNHA